MQRVVPYLPVFLILLVRMMHIVVDVMEMGMHPPLVYLRSRVSPDGILAQRVTGLNQ